MAYARSADELHHFVAGSSKPNVSEPKTARGFWRGLLQRLFDSMVDARRRGAEREIALFLRDRGGYLTDDAEREIERILSSSPRL
jgi:hypothetical protein